MSSAGIIAITSDDCLVLVKRPTTYAYNNFLSATYAWTTNMTANKAVLLSLFSLMISKEKKIIYNLDFQAIWTEHWLISPQRSMMAVDHRIRYDQLHKIFKERFITPDNGLWLRGILEAAASTSLLRLYEFPRGKINKGESILDAARREFGEETQIASNLYHIINEDKPLVHTISAEDNGKTYITYYYVAVITGNPHWQLKLSCFGQRAEIDEILLASRDLVRAINPELLHLTDRALAVLDVAN